jgi:hypothetical protein
MWYPDTYTHAIIQDIQREYYRTHLELVNLF